MSPDKQVRQLNERLRTELGEADFPHAWRFAPSLMHPGIEIDVDGNDINEHLCSCGVDVVIHKPECESLTIARKKVKMTRLLPGDKWERRWVLCRLHYPSQADWVRSYGTHVNYPQNGVWHPLTVNAGTIKTRPGQLPTLEDTDLVISIVREARKDSAADLTREWGEKEERADAEHRENLYESIKEATMPGLNPIPGKKLNTSYPGRSA